MRSSMPIYVVLEQEVLLHRLKTVKKIYTQSDLVIVIAKGILRNLDSMKKDNLEVREALRWMQGHISKGSKRVRVCHASSPMECAVEIVGQMPGSTSVVATILTLSKKMTETPSQGHFSYF